MYANPTNVQANAAQADILARWFLLREPERWTKGAFARKASGLYATGVRDPLAASWCLTGAGLRHCPMDIARSIIVDVVGDPPGVFNDTPSTTHSDILAALVKAFEIAGERA